MITKRWLAAAFWWAVAVAEWLLATLVFVARSARETIFGIYAGPMTPPEFKRYMRVHSLQAAPGPVAGVDSRPRGVHIQLQ